MFEGQKLNNNRRKKDVLDENKEIKMIKSNQKSLLLIVCSLAILFLPQIRGEESIGESTEDAEFEMFRRMRVPSDHPFQIQGQSRKRIPPNCVFQVQSQSGKRIRRSNEPTDGLQSSEVVRKASTTNNRNRVKTNTVQSVRGSSLETASVTQQASTSQQSNFFSIKGSEKLFSILSKPDEMLKLIAKHFNLDHEKLKKQVGQSVSLGAETVISRALVGIQIIEKVFVPDNCRLKLMCQAGAYVTARLQGSSLLLKLQPKHIESSHFVRAFSEGGGGKDCEGAFPNCEPKLQKPYEDLIRSARETLAPSRKHLNGNIQSNSHTNNLSSDNQVAEHSH